MVIVSKVTLDKKNCHVRRQNVCSDLTTTVVGPMPKINADKTGSPVSRNRRIFCVACATRFECISRKSSWSKTWLEPWQGKMNITFTEFPNSKSNHFEL